MTVESFALLASEPAEPFAAGKRRIAAAVEANRAEILELSHRIHANPEPAFEERQAAAWVAEAVARHGYTVDHPAGSLATAVRGVLRGGQAGTGPRVGILAEYDALPGLGHGCGHNSMAASGVGAAIALAAVASEVTGEIVFLGTPAEERGSGKGIMIRDGLFGGLDAALLYHPSDVTYVECRLLASEDIYVTFHGRQAHAASEPWMGRNALDALILLFSSVGLWRQQLRPDVRVHGIVQEGGTAANIIPSRSKAWFMVRSPRQDEYLEMRDRFREMCEAAATSTGCTVEIEFDGRRLDHEPQPDAGRPVRGEHGGVRRPGPPAVRQSRQQRHGQRQPGPPDDPSVDRDLRGGRARPLDRVPRGRGLAAR